MGDSKKKIELATRAIDKKYGKGTVFNLNEFCSEGVDAVSSGHLGLDLILGNGGFPKGRIAEVFGPEGSAKTSVCLHVVAEAQKLGLACFYVDAEHSLNKIYAETIGVNLDEMPIIQPNHGEQALDIVESLCEVGVDVIIVDSVAALATKAEIEGSMEDKERGGQARMMGQALRKLAPVVGKNNVLLIFVNQLRSTMNPYGNKEVTSGGNALKYYASIRLELKRKDFIRDSQGNFIGMKIRCKTIKNKMTSPFREVEIDLIFGKGIDGDGAILDIACDLGLINKSGSWYSPDITDQSVRVQGRVSTLEWLKQNREKFSILEKETRKLATQLLSPTQPDEIEDYDDSEED